MIARIAETKVNDAALAQAEALEHLKILHARFLSAEEDLPNRRQRLSDINRQLATLAGRISPERCADIDPSDLDAIESIAGLRIDAVAVGTLRDLMETAFGRGRRREERA